MKAAVFKSRQQTKGRLMGFTHSAYMVLIFDLWKKPRHPLASVVFNVFGAKQGKTRLSASKDETKCKAKIAL
jgi:hypothetical protein